MSQIYSSRSKPWTNPKKLISDSSLQLQEELLERKREEEFRQRIADLAASLGKALARLLDCVDGHRKVNPGWEQQPNHETAAPISGAVDSYPTH